MQDIVKRVVRLEKFVHEDMVREFRLIGKRFQALMRKMDLAALQQRQTGYRLERIEQDVTEIKTQVGRIRDSVERQTRWVAGILLSILIALLSAGLGIALNLAFGTF